MFTSVRVSPTEIFHGCQSIIHQIGRGLYSCSPTLLYAKRISHIIAIKLSRVLFEIHENPFKSPNYPEYDGRAFIG